MTKKKFLRYAFLILAVATMVYIFLMSAQPASISSKSSGRVIEKIAKIFIKDFENATPEYKISIIVMYQKLVRKSAHFIIYSCLGFSVCGHLLTYAKPTLLLKSVISFLVCFLYAISDEIHQLFVFGRSGQASDVILDCCGAIFGILIILFIFFCYKKIKVSNRGAIK